MKESFKLIPVIIAISTPLWHYLPKGSYYIIMALLVFSMSALIFNCNRKSFTGFFLLCLSLNNLYDETLGSPINFGANEIIFLVIVPIVWCLKMTKDV